jgi:hypothetical protein
MPQVILLLVYLCDILGQRKADHVSAFLHWRRMPGARPGYDTLIVYVKVCTDSMSTTMRRQVSELSLIHPDDEVNTDTLFF